MGFPLRLNGIRRVERLLNDTLTDQALQQFLFIHLSPLFIQIAFDIDLLASRKHPHFTQVWGLGLVIHLFLLLNCFDDLEYVGLVGGQMLQPCLQNLLQRGELLLLFLKEGTNVGTD